MYFNFLLSVPLPAPSPTPPFIVTSAVFSCSPNSLPVSARFIFPLFFPSFSLLFSLKTLAGCTKQIGIKAAGHLPFWFFFYCKKGKQCRHQIPPLIWPSTTNIQFDILHIVLMHFCMIYLAWFFGEGHSRGMTAAEDLCLICFKPHVRAEKQHLQSGSWSLSAGLTCIKSLCARWGIRF